MRPTEIIEFFVERFRGTIFRVFAAVRSTGTMLGTIFKNTNQVVEDTQETLERSGETHTHLGVCVSFHFLLGGLRGV